MILFDLKCTNGHVFEGWFASIKKYELQLKKGQIRCPACDDKKISKTLMAPNINTKSSKSLLNKKVISSDSDKIVKEIKKIKSIIMKNTDDVGKNFAEEARKIYYGESKARGIRGETTNEEAKELEDEGIPFAKIPWTSRGDA